MQLQIYVPQHFIDTAATMPPERRQAIEAAKAAQSIDEQLKTAAIRLKERTAGLENDLAEDEEAQFLANIRDTLDVVIALVAVCESPDDVTKLHDLGQSLGRRHNKPVQLELDKIYPALRRVFTEIEAALGVSSDTKSAKKLITRKIVATIAIINHALANKKTK